MTWRRNVKANHIVQFPGEGPVVGQLELTPAMRVQSIHLPDFPYRGCGQTDRLAHRPDRPVRRLVWRRFLGQTDDLGDFLVRRSRCGCPAFQRLRGRPPVVLMENMRVTVTPGARRRATFPCGAARKAAGAKKGGS